MNSEPLYQALIPKGQLAIKFEIPKYVDEYIIHLANDTSNIHNLNQQQIQFFSMTFKCCCISNACKYGVPKNLLDQYQIFSLTFAASFIDFLNSILKRNISYLDRYCAKIQPMLQNHETENTDSKLFEDALGSFAQIKSYNLITTEHIEKRSNEIRSFVELPSPSSIINDIDKHISQIIDLIKEIISKPEHNVSTMINTTISSIKTKSEELDKYYNESNEKLRSLFDPYSTKTYGNSLIFMDEFISALNDFIFMAIKIAFFSDLEQTENNNFFSCLYKIANNSISILTNVHKLAHYRTNYNLSVVSIKLNFSYVFESLPNIHKEIHNFLKFSPTLFQATTILEFTLISKKLFDADNEFSNQMNSFFTKIKSAKKSIVFKPITERQLAEKNESICFFNSFQKCAYTIAFSLIRNSYEAYQLTGMTVLLQNSYTKLINHLSSQIVNKKLTQEEKINYSLTFHSIQHAMSLFVNEFSQFGANPDDKFLRSKSSIVALNLVFEVYVCNSNIDMTDIMEDSIKMFLIFIGENNSMISSFYLVYRRAVQLSIYHSATLFSIFTGLLLKQLRYGADAPITNFEAAKKLNKMLQHKLFALKRYEIFDRAFTFPNSINETINELKNFVDSLVFCSENYKSILLESIKSYKNFCTLMNSSINRINTGKWDYDINFFKAYIEKVIIEIQNYRSLLSSSNNDKDNNDNDNDNDKEDNTDKDNKEKDKNKSDVDFEDEDKYVKNHSQISNSAHALTKTLFEICCLARQVGNIPITIVEELRSDIVDLLEKSIELSIMSVDDESEDSISNHYQYINKLLSQIEIKLSKDLLPTSSSIVDSEDKENDQEKCIFVPRDIFIFTSYDILWKTKKNQGSSPIVSNYIKKMKAFYQNIDKSLETFQKSFDHYIHKTKSKPTFVIDEQENQNKGFMLTSTVDPSSPSSAQPCSLNPRNKLSALLGQRPSSIKLELDPNSSLDKDSKTPTQTQSLKPLNNDRSKQRGIPIQTQSSSSSSSEPSKKNKFKTRSLTSVKNNECANQKESEESQNNENNEDSKFRSTDDRIRLSQILPISSLLNSPDLPEFNNWKMKNSGPRISPLDPDYQDSQSTDEDNKSEDNTNSIFPTLKVFDSDSVLTKAIAGRNKVTDFGIDDSSDSD